MSTSLTTSSLIFPDATSQTVSATLLGVGQSFRNVTGTSGKSFNTTNYNSTGRPIYLSITTSGNFRTTSVVLLIVDGVTTSAGGVISMPSSVASLVTLTGIIPVNSSYYITYNGNMPTITSWLELKT
jgi:hypothetical protein